MSASIEAASHLRELLWGAARNKFANIMREDLGEDLRRATAAWSATRGLDRELEELRRALERFEHGGRTDRSAAVALGMRLMMQHGIANGRATPSKPSSRARRSAGENAKPARTSTRVEPSAPEGNGELPACDRGALALEVTTLPRVGRATADKLAAHGFLTLGDLLYLLPIAYEDRRVRPRIEDVRDGDLVVFEGEVRSLRQGFARGRFMASLDLEVVQGDGPPRRIIARWFHRHAGLNRYARGGRVLAIGRARWFKGQLNLAHPELREPTDPGPAIAVRYPAVEGIAPRTLAKLVQAAVQRVCEAPDVDLDALPPVFVREHDLPSQREAFAMIHLPPADLPAADVELLQRAASPGHRRLAFDEFFFIQLACLRRRATIERGSVAITLTERSFDRERFRACLPFEPTAAQWRAIGEIEHDMRAGPPMLRLLQGDVGSGKTAVAFAAISAIVASGAQAALMAPTEVLAEQHFRTLLPWCDAAGVRVALLTGATPRAQRSSVLALAAAGRLDLIVGTHALLVDDVRFAELGLVVIDEQHRFGVEQRALLRAKGARAHLLAMTATPIPRTMALCVYGELEITTIDGLPPGRTPPRTELHLGNQGLQRARKCLVERVHGGEQAFVVCPLVEASDAMELTHVEQSAAAVRVAVGEYPVGIIHGRMTGREKDSVMRDFRAGTLRVLVATTVIEVGVDVPAASVILIEHAERFGLAQLHQLRGRVGRGEARSLCLLHAASEASVADRLNVLVETHDGFVIAERDLQLRGPGEVFGTRQAGVPKLRFAGLGGDGARLLAKAREAAAAVLAVDPNLCEHDQLRRELVGRIEPDRAWATEGG